MSRPNGSDFVAYRIAAVLVLVAFYIARTLGGSGSAIAVGAIGVPLIFLFGNYRSPRREPWSKVFAGIGSIFVFAALLISGMVFLDGRLDSWRYAVATIVWGGLLLGAFLYFLWRLERNRDESA